MEQQHCRYCGSETDYFCRAPILNYVGTYYKCPSCESVQVANPFWLEEAHSEAISQFDTGLVSRCSSASRLIALILFLEGKSCSSGIDWGGGTGLLTRMLRDLGFNARNFDIYAASVHSVGFNVDITSAEEPDCFAIATECLEHLVNPVEDLRNIVTSKDYFFFTTETIPRKTPDPNLRDWWYYMPESGQHVTFASSAGLSALCRRFDFDFYFKCGSIHIFSKKKLGMFTRMILKNKLFRFIFSILSLFFLSKRFSLTATDQKFLMDKHSKYIWQNESSQSRDIQNS